MAEGGAAVAAVKSDADGADGGTAPAKPCDELLLDTAVPDPRHLGHSTTMVATF